MWGRKQINAHDTMTDYISSTPDRAVKNMKDVMTALKYMDDGTVRNRLVLQSARIETRLRLLDETALPGWTKVDASGTWGTWVEIGLGDMWRPWIRQRFQLARDKASTYINRYLAVMETNYITNNPNPTGTLVGKIQALRQEWDTYRAQAWTNPLPSLFGGS